ncbi:importin-13 [Neocloeon triangulifer]|uniref:importin-13 n=1 Tax=Neocloeon triangulifer TaxID=2078957 RepID=UPI00286FA1EF|nr:importin-13 [Neocloeon triangulifer]XP_059479260.1 importin-13 [Neocloeon triangulifer]
MDFTAENVEAAVQQFYMTSSTLQAHTHQWLVAARTSKEAWSFVWALLAPEKAAEVQFFGASTLEAKISKFWAEVPAGEIEGLKKRLLEALLLHQSNKLILGRLCVSMALCALQTMPSIWPDPVSDILITFQPANIPNIPSENLAAIALEILSVLPEEFQTMHIAQGRKGEVRCIMQKSIPKVLCTVEDCLLSKTLCLRAVNCFKSWVQFGIQLSETEKITDYIYQIAERNLFSDAELTEGAVDALLAVSTHPESGKYPTSLLKMTEKWLRLHQLMRQSAERDPDVEGFVYRLLVMVAESHSGLVLKALLPPELGGLAIEQGCRDAAVHLVKVALDCSATPGYFPIHETSSEMSFSFWYLLQDNMTNLATDAYPVIKMELQPVYSSLTEALLNKSVLPEDLDSWSAEDQERFRCYRQDVADTMMYCYNVLEESMLNLLHCHLGQAFEKCIADKAQWRHLEACLHAFYSVSEAVNYDEEHYLPQLFNTLHRIPSGCHHKLISSALDLIGAYAEWINKHSDVLNQVVPILVTGLKAQEYATSATMALKDLTRDCQVSMQPFAELILHAGKEALDSGRLLHNESIRLMYPLGKVLSCLPTPSVIQHLQQIFIPYLEELRLMLQDQQAPPDVKMKIILRIKMFSMLFATLEPRQEDSLGGGEQPVVLVMQMLLPVFERVTVLWGQDPTVIEAMCSAIKYSVQNLLDGCRPLLPAMLNLLLQMFKQNPQPSALDLAQQFLILFSNDERHLMQTLLAEMVGLSLHICSSNVAEHTDLVESLMHVLAQVLKKSPQLFLNPQLDLGLLFHFAILSLGMAESSTVKAAISFLSCFIGQSREMEPLQVVVHTQGEELVRKILACIGGESSRTISELMSDLLLALNKKYFDYQTRWLQNLMAVDGFPSIKVSPEVKQSFVKNILKERANKRKMQENVREFSLACRGMIGSEYAQVSPYF